MAISDISRIEVKGNCFMDDTELKIFESIDQNDSGKIINNSTRYFACLNPLFIEKLDTNLIKILIQKHDVDQEVLNIIANTFKDIIKKEGVTKVCYDPPMPKHVVENGTIVLQFLYGKNSKKTISGDWGGGGGMGKLTQLGNSDHCSGCEQ